MTTIVTTRGLTDDRRLRALAQEKTNDAVQRFAERIMRVEVRLEDVTGPHRQAHDKQWKINVRLRRGGDIRIEELRDDEHVALDSAIDRMREALRRRIGRTKHGVGAG